MWRSGCWGRAFAQASGHEVDFDFGTVGALQAKLDAGETADVVILSVPGIDKLAKAGALAPGSRKNVAKTFIAFCIRDGAPRPDFSTAEAFRRLLEGAKAIATSDPAVGGSAGVHLAKMFEQSGLAAMMQGKSLPQQSGVEVAKRVVEGKAEFGLTLSGEVASVPGAVIAGALPPPFGQDTTYCAAVMTASTAKDAGLALIAALTRPETRETWKRQGSSCPDRNVGRSLIRHLVFDEGCRIGTKLPHQPVVVRLLDRSGLKSIFRHSQQPRAWVGHQDRRVSCHDHLADAGLFHPPQQLQEFDFAVTETAPIPARRR